MRRFTAIVKATALEILSEPLSLLLLSAALSLTVFAPAFHYHQFGEPTRMARDAGVSAIFLGGFVFAATAAVRTLRREIESGTASAALSHPLSRAQFFGGKCAGVVLAVLAFAVTVGAVTLTMVKGAEIGGELAERNGDVARIWGPSYALGIAAIVLPYLVGAGLNRFARCRFALTAFLTALAVAVAGLAYRFDGALAWRYLPVLILAAAPTFVLALAAAAAAVRLKVNGAALVSAALVLAFLPVAGNYSQPEALARGGSLDGGYLLAALSALLPAAVAFLGIGGELLKERDL